MDITTSMQMAAAGNLPEFDATRCKRFILKVVAYRRPEKGEFYIDKFGKLNRSNYSRHSSLTEPRVIVEQVGWEGEEEKAK